MATFCNAAIIHVSSYGATPDDGIDDTAAINDAIAAAGSGDTVVFAAGVYDLITPWDSARYIRVSKNNLTLQGAVSGGEPATELLRHVPVQNRLVPPRTVYFWQGSNIVFENFIMDNNPRLSTAGEVTYISGDGTTLRVAIFDDLPMEAGTSCYSANAWLPNGGNPVLKKVPSLTLGVNLAGSPANWTIYDAPNRVMQLYKSTGLDFLDYLDVGDYMSWHYGNLDDGEQLYAFGTDGLTVRNLKVPNTLNVFSVMGVVNDLTLDTISLKSDDNQLAVGPRDGFHLSRCTGTMTMTNLVMEGLRLDPIVVRTPSAEIISITDPRNFRTRSEKPIGGQTITSGSNLRLYDASGNIYTRTVSSATYIPGSGTDYDIVTTTDLPAIAGVGTYLTYNALAPDSISITDSSFANTAGGAIILLAGNVTVDNVDCYRIMNPAIKIGSNISSGSMGTNYVVKNSTFEDSGWMPVEDFYGMIAVENTNSVFTDPQLKNVTITNNNFINQLSAGPAINIANTDNFTVSNNYFENVNLGLTIDTTSSSGWTVTGNEVVIDNSGNSSTYGELSGLFNNSSLTGYDGTSTRYSGTPGAKAEWTFASPKTDNYAVYVYKVVYGNSDTNAKITVNHKYGSNVTYVDYTSGTSGWVYLGTHAFDGQNAYTITNERSNNNLRADSVLFVQQ